VSDLTYYDAVKQQMEYTDDVMVPVSDASPLTPVIKTAGDFLFTIDYQNVIALMGITGFYSCILTYLSYGFMMILARALIQIMLVFSVILALAWGIIGLTLDPYGVISIMGFTALLASLGYTMYNWNRIPFAATNFYTALCAMRCTADITILGFCCLLVAFAWIVVWGMAFMGIVNSLNSIECTAKNTCGPHVANNHLPLYFLMLLSFHWTNTVIKNITRVTVASVVGTWWFFPGDIGPFCTPAVIRPLLRAVTKSLGSICYGSLVVQPAQFLSVINKCCCCLLGNPESNCMYPQSSLNKLATEIQAKANTNVLEAAQGDDVDSPAESVGLVHRLSLLHNRINASLRSCNRWSYTYIGMCKFCTSLALSLYVTPAKNLTRLGST
jgi:Plasma-membrane choline transporter